MMHIDTEALHTSLEFLRKTPYETDVVRALQRVVSSVDELFGYDGAGIMLIDEEEQLHYVAASDEVGRSLEQAQIQAEEGPCWDTYVVGHPVSTKDVRSDARWPQLVEVLDERVRAVAGVPILLGGSPVGTLNVYRSQPYGWDDSDISALRAYAGLISELMAAAVSSQEHSVTATQLQYALDYRVIIERAIGYLMATHRVDAVSAFNRLRKQARDNRRRVADLAAEILEKGVS
ncbi:GAF and ANTAR domain-containing protein [Actinomadura graeca]|uniref:GAF and ANTAR domain-containing protein n=1 Tax=Actinomadura graeca TaxID=2750812 RepID=A0ABX8QU54_9ACTN|nr:GAF and ANTAR domain-containing protein [Actinomadura graeca]QXJ22277.1 GAF and ANTAR domain-containing protein [Actinomadura graeca]